jgi:hypothetical protein
MAGTCSMDGKDERFIRYMYFCTNLNSQGDMGVHRSIYDNESENE